MKAAIMFGQHMLPFQLQLMFEETHLQPWDEIFTFPQDIPSGWETFQNYWLMNDSHSPRLYGEITLTCNTLNIRFPQFHHASQLNNKNTIYETHLEKNTAKAFF